MFPRLPGPITDDIFLGATTTVRTAFPNSRLDSLTNHNQQTSLHHTNSNSNNNNNNHQQHNYAQPTSTPAINGNNQLLSPYDPTISSDFLATAAINDAIENVANSLAGSSGNSGSISSISNSFLPANINDDDDFWLNAIEEDTFESPLAFDASENGLWNGRFVPPPPRPPFLDESVAADGLTTCDLCTWAWQRNAYSLDGSLGKWE